MNAVRRAWRSLTLSEDAISMGCPPRGGYIVAMEEYNTRWGGRQQATLRKRRKWRFTERRTVPISASRAGRHATGILPRAHPCARTHPRRGDVLSPPGDDESESLASSGGHVPPAR